MSDDDDQDDLFGKDPDRAKRARDRALKRIAENSGDWRPMALSALCLISGFEGTWEDIRIKLVMVGVRKPHHHNAWGEVSMAAIKKRLIIPTGRSRHMKTEKSHGRRTPVYVVR